MGVPKFYRWLSERYPQINQLIISSELLPQFDAMYLDANGIIHTCTHPNDEDVTSNVLSMKEMVSGIFDYISNMVKKVKPTKVLYIAIDGCAPRAKMNQQRSRRFASARDRLNSNIQALQQNSKSEDEILAQFDSNCITPGTKFMADISLHLTYFIRKKIKEDPLWANLKVYYSGHDVPGEGEHKIMDFIRSQRTLPGYDPNTRHCLCGLDADLIMLGLASQEIHFSLLREVVNFQQFSNNNNNNNNKSARNFKNKTKSREEGGTGSKAIKDQIHHDNWQLLHLSTLRSYFDLEFSKITLPNNVVYDLGLIINDLVTLLALVGNDFLPHIPSLHIREGALDKVFEVYKGLIAMHGYITDKNQIDFKKLEILLKELGEDEARVFRERAREQAREAAKEEQRRQSSARREEDLLRQTLPKLLSTVTPPPSSPGALNNDDSIGTKNEDFEEQEDDEDDDTRDEKALKAILLQATNNKTADFKALFYRARFGIDTSTTEGKIVLDRICKSYLEGLWFCHQYYFEGVDRTSWVWFYPFHYAPLLSDLENIERFLPIQLPLGAPFTPFKQLLGCLPAASSSLLPAPYRQLMVSPTSPIRDFYPETFKVDMDGKRNAWEGVNLLPFIDEARLSAAVRELCPDSLLSQEELLRNKFGKPYVFQADSTNVETFPSSLPGFLPDIAMCGSKASVFEIPNDLVFSRSPLPGARPVPGDPQLGLLNLDIENCKLEPIQIGTFGRPSTLSTFVLRSPTVLPDNRPTCYSERDRIAPANKLKIDTPATVWVGYPYLYIAAVVGFVDQVTRLVLNDFEILTEPKLKKASTILSAGKQVSFKSENLDAKAVTHFKDTKAVTRITALKGISIAIPGGLDIGECSVFVIVRALKGMYTVPQDGSQVQYFEETDIWIPSQLAFPNNPLPDTRFLPSPRVSLSVRYPVDSSILCLAPEAYGHIGLVSSVDDATNSITARVLVQEHNMLFGKIIAANVVDAYYNSTHCARVLKLQKPIFEKLVSSWSLRDFHDIGLNIVVEGHYVPGYACPVGLLPHNGENKASSLSTFSTAAANAAGGDSPERWLYSKKTIDVVNAYIEKFPLLFDKILRSSPNRMMNKYELFSTKEDVLGDQGLARVTKWLSQLDCSRVPLVPMNSQVMSKNACEAVESASHLVMQSAVANNKVVTLNLTPEQVATSTQYKNSATISLGDRVSSLGRNAPLGLRGIVVGVHRSTLLADVIFDSPFVGGSSLFGLCSALRGKRVPMDSLLPCIPASFVASNAKAKAPSAPASKATVPITPKSPDVPAAAISTSSKNDDAEDGSLLAYYEKLKLERLAKKKEKAAVSAQPKAEVEIEIETKTKPSVQKPVLVVPPTPIVPAPVNSAPISKKGWGAIQKPPATANASPAATTTTTTTTTTTSTKGATTSKDQTSKKSAVQPVKVLSKKSVPEISPLKTEKAPATASIPMPTSFFAPGPAPAPAPVSASAPAPVPVPSVVIAPAPPPVQVITPATVDKDDDDDQVRAVRTKMQSLGNLFSRAAATEGRILKQ